MFRVKLFPDNSLIEKSKFPKSLFIEGFEKEFFKNYPLELINTLSRSLMNGRYDYMHDKKMSIKEQKTLLNEAFEMSWTMLTPFLRKKRMIS